MDQTISFDVNTMVRQYVSTFPPRIDVEGVFLFGSFARGDQRDDSDVDLIVVSKDFADMHTLDRMILLSRLRRNAPLTRQVAMDIFGYTPEEFAHLEDESVIMQQAKKEGRFVWKRSDSDRREFQSKR